MSTKLRYIWAESKAEISRRFEELLHWSQRHPNAFRISDPNQSRRLINSLKPGTYRVIWMGNSNDGGNEQMIIDGDLILRMVECSNRRQISLFTRER